MHLEWTLFNFQKKKECIIHLQRNVCKLTASLKTIRISSPSCFILKRCLSMHLFFKRICFKKKKFKNKSPNNITHVYNKHFLAVFFSIKLTEYCLFTISILNSNEWKTSMKTNLDIRLMFPYRVHQSKIGMLNLSKVLKDII